MASAKRPDSDDAGSSDGQFRRKHFCHKCTASFKTMEELYEHYKKVHRISKSFFCAMCFTIFPDHQPFAAHLNTCPGRIYKCNFISCRQTFSDLGLLQAHVTAHRTWPVLSEPEPSGSGSEPEPSGSGSKPEPSGSGSKPQPSGSGSKPQPFGSGSKQEPSGSGSSTHGVKRRKILPKVSVETIPLQLHDGDVKKSIINRYEESKSK